MIFKKSHVLIDQNFKNKKELFKFLGYKAIKIDIAKKAEMVSNAFAKRESEGTTGFEDGFAIPHARINGINNPSVFIIRNKDNFKDWDSLDGNGVQYAIALMIPGKSGSLHMEVLSSIATKLMDNKFREIIKTGSQKQIFELFSEFLLTLNNKKDKKELMNTNSNKKLLIGISACPAGIAHTFMAKQKMEDAAHELDMDIKWETQGANGQKNLLTESDIEKASIIIIASDIDLDLQRFNGKKIFVTSTNDAIKNGAQLVKRAEKNGRKFDSKVKVKHNNKFLSFFLKLRKSFQTSFGKPWAYLSITGSMLALLSLIGYSAYGSQWTSNARNLNLHLFKIQEIAKFALYLSMPFMAGSVAKKATEKSEAFTIAFMGTFLLNIPTLFTGWNTITNGEQVTENILFNWNYFSISDITHGSNIFGAIIVTFVTILVINLIRRYTEFLDDNNDKRFCRFLRMGTSPWVTTLTPVIIILVGIVYLFGAPLAFISSGATYGIIEYARNYWWLRLIIGGIFGLMIAWDLGGIVNKIGLILLIGLAQYDLRFASIISVGIPLASIGYGTTFIIFKKHFRDIDARDAKLSFRKGLNGMTEGPLFLTNKYKLRVIIPNLVSTFVATGLSLVIGLYIFKGGHLGILFVGGQADLSQANDISFLNQLLPRGYGIVTAICSIAYGIIGYYLVIVIGAFTYVGIAGITFSIPGKNRVFK